MSILFFFTKSIWKMQLFGLNIQTKMSPFSNNALQSNRNFADRYLFDLKKVVFGPRFSFILLKIVEKSKSLRFSK